MKTNFNKKRLSNLLKWEYEMNRRELVRTFLWMTAALVLLFGFFIHRWRGLVIAINDSSMSESFQAQDFNYTTVILAAIPLFFLMWFFYAGSHPLEKLKTKEQRIAYYILPATTAEKFFVRIFVSFAANLLCLAAALLAADLIQYILALFILQEGHSVTLELMQMWIMRITSSDSVSVWSPLASFLALVAVHAHMVLCCTLFPKKPAMYAVGSIALFFMLLTIVSATFVEDLFDYLAGDVEEVENLARAIVAGFIGFFALYATFAYVTGYQLFKKMQVVTHKWINV